MSDGRHTEAATKDRVMNTYIFSAFGRTVARTFAPALLAASTLFGTLGVSSVASAQERVVVAAPAGAPVREEVLVGAPVVVHHRRRVPYVAPWYYGPSWGGYYGPGFRGYGGWGGYHGGWGGRGWGGYHGGNGGFHGGGGGGFHGGGGGGFHGGGGHR
jgi:hypothetical protein